MPMLKKIQNLTYPIPVALIVCRKQKGDESTDNIIPLSWVGILEYRPDHIVYISIGNGKYSAKVIESTGEFGICIATVDMMEKVDICGYTHGDKVDKFKLVNFTKVAAEKINVSLIKECPISMECIVDKIVQVELHRMFIGKIIATHVNEKYLLKNEELDFAKMNILCNINDQYWTIGKKLEDQLYTKKRKTNLFKK
jgi:flavin reductase (DIM6/NTAB) family NADH-FMN oxidoreductase RutF